jgi:hypothetical protein
MDRVVLFELVNAFRVAVARESLSGFPEGLELTPRFPKGACKDVSRLLAAHLTDNGFPGSRMIEGDAGGSSRELGGHAWLALGELWIDITGSQFEGYQQPDVLISSGDEFLKTWEPAESEVSADFRIAYDVPGYESWLANYSHAYTRIKGSMRFVCD